MEVLLSQPYRLRQALRRCCSRILLSLSEGNWVEYNALRAYEDDQESTGNTTRSRKHKKQGRRGGGKTKPPKKYLVPPMQYVKSATISSAVCGVLLQACESIRDYALQGECRASADISADSDALLCPHGALDVFVPGRCRGYVSQLWCFA